MNLAENIFETREEAKFVVCFILTFLICSVPIFELFQVIKESFNVDKEGYIPFLSEIFAMTLIGISIFASFIISNAMTVISFEIEFLIMYMFNKFKNHTQ